MSNKNKPKPIVRRRAKRNPNRIRVKKRVAGGELAFVSIVSKTSGLTTHQIINPVHIKKFEYMRDTTGYLDCDFNPCFHDKLLCRPTPQHQVSSNPGEDLVQWQYAPGGPSPGNLCYAFRELELPGITEWLDDFSASAEHHFKSAVTDTYSLLNFIIELIELCEGNIRVLKKLADKFSLALKQFWKMFGETGNYWLSWNFAIKPTIKDIKAMLDVLKAAQKRLKWLRKRNHLDTKVKYRQQPREWSGDFTVAADFFSVDPSLGLPTPPAPTDCYFKVTYDVEVRPSAWGWVRFDIPDYLLDSTIEAVGVIWAAMSGLYNPLKVAWEAVPFSWLIDWFVNRKTQLQLEAASLSPLKDARIHATGHSITLKCYGIITFVDGAGTETLYGPYRYTSFARKPNLPFAERFPFSVPISWYQASILAALVQQKHRRG